MNFTEIVIIMAIALILFGPEDLPDIARMIGKIVYEIRKAVNDLTSEFEDVVKEPVATMNKALDDITKLGRSSSGAPKAAGHVPEEPGSEKLGSKESGGGEASGDEIGPADELLTYDDELDAKDGLTPGADDPLAQLPSGMVSYEEEKGEKGSSR